MPLASLDPVFRVLDDISTSLFVHVILNQEAPPHFSLPKFQMYNGLQDPFDHLMHYRHIMTLQTGNDALLCKVFSSSLAGLALSWFHRLASNLVTSFCRLSEKFISQYICLVRRKQSVTSLFHVQMGRSETIRDFMKQFGSALLQLDSVSSYTALHAVKQNIRSNTQFFDSFSLQPPTSIDELFQRGNQYAMFKDDVIAETRRAVAKYSESRSY